MTSRGILTSNVANVIVTVLVVAGKTMPSVVDEQTLFWLVPLGGHELSEPGLDGVSCGIKKGVYRREMRCEAAGKVLNVASHARERRPGILIVT